MLPGLFESPRTTHVSRPASRLPREISVTPGTETADRELPVDAHAPIPVVREGSAVNVQAEQVVQTDSADLVVSVDVVDSPSIRQWEGSEPPMCPNLLASGWNAAVSSGPEDRTIRAVPRTDGLLRPAIELVGIVAGRAIAPR
jgi:hypothetical protein